MTRTVTWNKRVDFSRFKHIWGNAIYDECPVNLRHFFMRSPTYYCIWGTSWDIIFQHRQVESFKICLFSIME